MKKTLFVLIILILGVLTFYLYFIDKNDDFYIKAVESINRELSGYCEQLELNAIASHCPTCKYASVNCTFVNSSEFEICHYYRERPCILINGSSLGGSVPLQGHDFCWIENVDDRYSIMVEKGVIYGQNNRPGNIKLNFTLDKNGNVIAKNAPLAQCL